jgi:hypothetical protein
VWRARRWVCAALALVPAACKQQQVAARPPDAQSAAAAELSVPPPAHPPNADTALALVNRFVVAESLGNWWAADTLVAWRSCSWNPATDFLPVTTAIRVQAALPVGDSARVQVIYDMAGLVWLAPTPAVGPQRTRFAARASSDTVVYRVFADSTGRLWMACGDFHQNHVAVSQLHEFVQRFDDSARAAWKAVFPNPQH